LKVPREKNPNARNLRSARVRQQAIGHELRRLYDSVVPEPIPDEFLELLSKIDADNDVPEDNSS
jgi:hypothetical protein